MTTLEQTARSESQTRAPLRVLLAAGLLLLPLVVFLYTRLEFSGDGTTVVVNFTRLDPPSLRVQPVVTTENALQPNDLVIAIDGIGINDLFIQNLTRLASPIDPHRSSRWNYTVIRNGTTTSVSVQAAPFPLARVLTDNWSTFLLWPSLFIMGVLVLVRRPRLPIARMFLLISSTGLTAGTMYALSFQPSDLLYGWVVPFVVLVNTVFWLVTVAATLHFTLVFPRPFAKLTTHPRLVWGIYGGVWALYLLFMLIGGASNTAGIVELNFEATQRVTVFYFPLAIFGLIVNYRSLREPVERRQARWVLWGLTVGLSANVIALALASFFGLSERTVLSVTSLVLLCIPISFAIAILRERLFDIDLIINRTLVYAPLLGILAGVFAASISLSQLLFTGIFGAKSDAATVLTTLIVVALFTPIKERLEKIVEKRFKEVPDPTKELKAYREQVHSVLQVIDVQEIARRALETSVRAFEAEGGAVFLQADGKLKAIQTIGKWDGQSKITIPLENDGLPIGQLSLSARRNGDAYSGQDRELLKQNLDVVARALALAQNSHSPNAARD